MITTNNGTKFYVGNQKVRAMYQGDLKVYASDASILFGATAGSNTLHLLPKTAGFDCIIDWGDGLTTPAPVDGGNIIHNYAIAADYTIKISGVSFAGFGVDNQSGKEKYKELYSMGSWEIDTMDSMEDAFYGCNNLTSIDKDAFKNATSILSFKHAFRGCTALQSIPAGLFDNCPNVTSFNRTFRGCSALLSIPTGLFDKCINAEVFWGTFEECTELLSIPSNLFALNPLAVDFDSVFKSCSKITSIPENLFAGNPLAYYFDTSFCDCSKLLSIPEGLFANNIQASSFDGIFMYCTSLLSIPENLFINNINAINFDSAFEACSGITSIPTNLFAGNPLVSSFGKTFYSCIGLLAIPANLFLQNINVTSFYETFELCEGITAIPEGLFVANTKVEEFNLTFSYMPNLVTVPDNLFATNVLATTFEGCFSHSPKLVLNTYLFGTNYATRFNGKIVNFSSCFSRGDSELETYPISKATAPALWNFTGLTPIGHSTCFAGTLNSPMYLTNGASIPVAWGGFDETPASVLFTATAGSNTLHLRNSQYFCQINWGDGTSLTNVPTIGGNITHTYALAGDYTITISGLRFGGFYVYAQTGKEKYKALNHFGKWRPGYGPTTIQSAFEACTSLQSIGPGALDYLTECTTAKRTFYACTSLATTPANLFKYNTLITSFCQTFCLTDILILRADIFGTDYATRFNGKTVDFEQMLFRSALKVCSTQGEAPALWNFTGLTPLITGGTFDGDGNSTESISNYTSIPLAWGGFPNAVLASILFGATAGSNTLHLYTATSGYACVIDWGDGTKSIAPGGGGNVTHNYSLAGDYTITIRGSKFHSFNVNNQTGKEKYKVLYSMGSFKNNSSRTYGSGCFRGCNNLTSVSADAFKYMPVTTLSYSFYGCTSLTSIPVNLLRYNTAVTDVSYLFSACGLLTTIPTDLFRYNINILDFSSVFAACTVISSIPETLFLYNTLATSFNRIFVGCTGLTAIPPLLFSTNTKATSFQSSFEGCINITSIPANLFMNNINVTSFGSVFYNLSKITSVPTDLFRYNIKVTSFSRVFYGCSLLETLPVDLFRYNPLVISFESTFYMCPKITSVSADLFRYNTEVVTFERIFHGAGGLTSPPSGLFQYNTKVTTFLNAFWNSGIVTIPTDFFRYNVLVTDFSYVFRYAFALIAMPADLFTYNVAATNFTCALDGCKNLVVKSDMFGVNYASRFAGKTVNFTDFLTRPSWSGASQGAAPPLWSFTFTAVTTLRAFSGVGNSATSLSNYASIPAAWKT